MRKQDDCRSLNSYNILFKEIKLKKDKISEG